jgi:hypothetical protein
MPFSPGPYALSAPPAERPILRTSRSIDFTTKRYEVDTAGNFVAMPSTAQRVMLLASFAGGEDPDVITPQTMLERANRIRAALRVLTDGTRPAIADLTVDTVRHASGTTRTTVNYRDLYTGEDGEVQL